MRILTTLAALGLLLGAISIAPAKADCRTTCHGNSAGGGNSGNQTCETHCW